jgi:hypothetical protein
MKLVSKIVCIVAVLFLASACGKARLEEQTTLAAQAHSTFDAETAYLNLPAPDYNVSFTPMMYGGSTQQRQTAIRFCRKSAAVVPNPVYSYACWEHSSYGAAAQSLYASLAAYRHYGLSIGMIGGAIEEAVASDESLICQKVTPTVPQATSTYDCFKKL